MATVMTFDRKKIMINAEWMQANATLLRYAKASDGIWVPICDLQQYEIGNRPFRN